MFAFLCVCVCVCVMLFNIIFTNEKKKCQIFVHIPLLMRHSMFKKNCCCSRRCCCFSFLYLIYHHHAFIIMVGHLVSYLIFHSCLSNTKRPRVRVLWTLIYILESTVEIVHRVYQNSFLSLTSVLRIGVVRRYLSWKTRSLHYKRSQMPFYIYVWRRLNKKSLYIRTCILFS